MMGLLASFEKGRRMSMIQSVAKREGLFFGGAIHSATKGKMGWGGCRVKKRDAQGGWIIGEGKSGPNCGKTKQSSGKIWQRMGQMCQVPRCSLSATHAAGKKGIVTSSRKLQQISLGIC
jgi:hypothetical protein